MWRAFAFLLPLLGLAQDVTKYSVELLAKSHQFTEGPTWSAKENYLLYSDIPANQIFRIDGRGKTVFREQSGGANGNGFDDKGRLYTCEQRARRVVRTDKNGAVQVLAEAFEGKKLNGPNDIVVSKNEHVYFTDSAFGTRAESRELPFNGVYLIPPKGPMVALLRMQTRPNGIAISPDGKILYVGDSDGRCVRSYELQKDGTIGSERMFVAKTEGVPDGIEVDASGNVFVAAAKIFVYSPEGQLLTSIEFGEKPSNMVFGDPELKTLYVTARSSVYRVHMETKGVALY
jgi:gluconolactonase